jgi:hypothetical protein
LSLADELRVELTDLQGSDGGFRASPVAPPTVESTAYAILALGGASADRGANWLWAAQLPNGAFPHSPSVQEPSWSTAVALIALRQRASGVLAQRLASAAAWLGGRHGRSLGWWARYLRLLRPREERVDQDPSLEGWPWHEAATSWVEPTALALVALRQTGSRTPELGARIDEGERMLMDRMCPGGGWNYGNKRVLDFQLEPFPDVTALALLALRGSRFEAQLGETLARLEEILASTPSTLALALGALALDAYARSSERWRSALAARHAQPQRWRDARSLALSVLALERRAEALAP